MREKTHLLDDIPNFSPEDAGVDIGDVFAFEVNFSARRLDESVDQTKSRAFPAARGSHQNEHLTLVDIHGQVRHSGGFGSGI